MFYVYVCFIFNSFLAEALESLKAQFEVLRSKIMKDSTKAAKIEQKVKITQQGYLNRSEKVCQGLASAFQAYDTALIEKGDL